MANGLTLTARGGLSPSCGNGLCSPSPTRKRPPGRRTTRAGRSLAARSRAGQRSAAARRLAARRRGCSRRLRAQSSTVGVAAPRRSPSCRRAWCRARANSRSCPWPGSPRGRRARRSWRPGPCAPARRPLPGSTTLRSAASQSATQAAITGVLAQVPRLVGIGLQIEQLRRHADVVHVLEFAFADHEGAGGGAGGVIFAHDGALRAPCRATMSSSGAPGRSRSLGVARQPDAIEDGREAIDQRDRLAADDARRHLGSGHDHRHAGRLLVHVGLAPQPARAEVVAVVAGVDDARVAGEAVVLERLAPAGRRCGRRSSPGRSRRRSPCAPCCGSSKPWS